ncbi:winged helix-turn-helix domain-containing protein [Alkalihalobacterium alkalinitrilicum]|uniref:winged helix-turn-helix domain-containing protein n=1 Tax=Alkalihalobacterium alkalinitrilicum TaxID=427920 RepID=UPI000994C2B8|nr:helix-turn-helix domain-containing protein [Alkalihalobacterium alkalinitrilicum]
MIDEIRNWKKREGSIKESVWLSEGVQFFRRLVDENPKNKEYKTELARLLIRSGTDEKLKYVNLMNAKHLFEEVLELFPNNGEAFYRLGHIFYENDEFEKSITYFTNAVSQSLSEIRLFRAYCAISKAYYHLGEDEKSNNYLQKAIEVDKENNFTSEINEVRSLITQCGHLRRLVRYSDGINQFLPVEEAEKLRIDADSDGEAVLDLSHFHPSFIGPIDVVPLERKEAELLSYLIERDYKFVSKEELFNVWEEDEQPAIKTIVSYISTIKRKVMPCLPVNSNEMITSKRGMGYRWTCSIPTKIIKQL